MKQGCGHRSQRSWTIDALTSAAPKHLPHQFRQREDGGPDLFNSVWWHRTHICSVMTYPENLTKKQNTDSERKEFIFYIFLFHNSGPYLCMN